MQGVLNPHCWLILTLLFFSCQKKHYPYSFRVPNDALSKKIDHSSISASKTYSKTFSRPEIRKPSLQKFQPGRSSYQKSVSPGLKEHTTLSPKQKKELSGDVPFNFKKHSNAFWQIGGVLLVSGLGFLVLSLTLALKIAKGDGRIFLWGIIIGLCLIVLSIPFIITGAIIGSV